MDPHEEAAAQGFPVCRICHGDAGETFSEELIAPCLCTGSVQWCHRGCLETWIRSSESRSKGPRALEAHFRCELCDFPLCMEQRFATSSEALRQLGLKVVLLSAPALLVGLLVGYCLRYDVGLLVAGAFIGLWALADAALALLAALWAAVTSKAYPSFGQGSLVGSSLQRLATQHHDLHEEELQELTGFSHQQQRRCQDRRRRSQQQQHQQQQQEQQQQRGGGGGGHEDEDDDASGDSRLRKLPSGCRMMLFIFPTLLPQIFTSVLFWLREFLGPNGLSNALFSLSALAGGYYPFALVLAAVTTVKRPPKVVIRTATGLPKFRSMSLAERELLKLDRSPPAATVPRALSSP